MPAFRLADWNTRSDLVETDQLRVLLIGGSSGVGKSTVARQVARQLGFSLMQVDDIRMAIQAVTTPQEQPALHFFISEPGVPREGIWRHSPETLCEGLIAVGNVVSRALDPVIGHHLTVAGPVVLEGDGIVPSLAARHGDAVSLGRGGVRAVFLTEPDEAVMLSRVQQLHGAAGGITSEERTIVRMHWLYGRWLQEQAAHFGLPVVSVRPYRNLSERIEAQLATSFPVKAAAFMEPSE